MSTFVKNDVLSIDFGPRIYEIPMEVVDAKKERGYKYVVFYSILIPNKSGEHIDDWGELQILQYTFTIAGAVFSAGLHLGFDFSPAWFIADLNSGQLLKPHDCKGINLSPDDGDYV